MRFTISNPWQTRRHVTYGKLATLPLPVNTTPHTAIGLHDITAWLSTPLGHDPVTYNHPISNQQKTTIPYNRSFLSRHGLDSGDYDFVHESNLILVYGSWCQFCIFSSHLVSVLFLVFMRSTVKYVTNKLAHELTQ